MPQDDIQFNPEIQRLNTKLLSSIQEPVYATIVSSPANPVYTTPTNSMTQPVYSTIITSDTDACRQGQLYVTYIADLSTPLNAGNYSAIQINNPTNSNKTLYFKQLYGFNTYPQQQSSASDYLQADLFKDATFKTELTPSPKPLSIYNRNFGSSNSSLCTTSYVINAGDPIQGTPQMITHWAQPISFSYVSIDLAGNIIVPPGHSFTLRLYNSYSKAVTLSMDILWWESNF